jgi:hypothetical protein
LLAILVATTIGVAWLAVEVRSTSGAADRAQTNRLSGPSGTGVGTVEAGSSQGTRLEQITAAEASDLAGVRDFVETSGLPGPSPEMSMAEEVQLIRAGSRVEASPKPSEAEVRVTQGPMRIS